MQQNNEINVLIVEDDGREAKLLKSLLERNGYTVVGIAKTYEIACKLLDSCEADIAILDIQLKYEKGEIDLYGGVKVAEYIKEKHHIPFIFLTFMSQNEDIKERAWQTLPSGFCPKPFNTQSILLEVERAIRTYSTSKTEDKKEGSFSLNGKLWIPNAQGGYDVVKFQNVIYIKTEEEITKIFTNQIHKPYTKHYCSLKKIIRDIPILAQTNKNHAVNLEMVTKYFPTELYLTSPFEKEPISITLSENFSKEIKEKLGVH